LPDSQPRKASAPRRPSAKKDEETKHVTDDTRQAGMSFAQRLEEDYKSRESD